MKISWIILALSVVLFSVLALTWVGRTPVTLVDDLVIEGAPNRMSSEVITLGIIPERKIFAQRRRYLALAEYLEGELAQPIELLTDNSYLGILSDYELGRIDGAFLGSLIAVLAMDRFDAEIAVKPVTSDGISSYRGVIFVRADSPIQTLADLAGESLATVRATTAGDLYPIYELKKQGLLPDSGGPTVNWLGTHDAVIGAVANGRFSAGAAKDLRIDAYLAEAGAVPLRRLSVGSAVPNNALVLAANQGARNGARLSDQLLAMHESARGQAVLAELGFSRFVPCSIDEYEPVLAMIRELGADWELLEIDGAPPLAFSNDDEKSQIESGG